MFYFKVAINFIVVEALQSREVKKLWVESAVFCRRKILFIKYPSPHSLDYKDTSKSWRQGDSLRGNRDFKTQPAVGRRFRPVLGGCHCLEQ